MADVTPEKRAYLVGYCLRFFGTCSCGNRCKKVVAAIREAEHAALERAAAICDADAKVPGNPDRQIAMREAAAAIRALKR